MSITGNYFHSMKEGVPELNNLILKYFNHALH